MSNGARLTAVIVVVAVAAVGLYLAFVAPSKAPSADPLAANGSIPAPTDQGHLGTIEPGSGIKPPPESAVAPVEPAGAGPRIPGAAGAAAAGGAAPAGNTPAGGGTPAAPGAGGVQPIGAGAAQAAASATDYTIKSGDTLEGIARSKLGDGQKWHAIVDLNPGLDPKALKVGQTIKLPAAAGLSDAAKAAAGTAGGAAAAGEAAAAAGNSYTVQKGDTLVALSRKFYGNDTEWKRILEANASLLKGDATAIKPGMKLTIPAKR